MAAFNTAAFNTVSELSFLLNHFKNLSISTSITSESGTYSFQITILNPP